MQTTPLIQVSELVKRYVSRNGPVLAVDRASFEVQRGQFVSLLGPSGCGKSTLLMIIAGLLSRTSGDVRIAGQVVDRAQTNIGIVFQSPVLLDWRRALDNVMIQVEVRGLDRATYRRRALDLLDLVGLAGFENKYPFELSGGMRQRVSICRALIHDPPLLLMDEPFGALDALTREQLNLDLQRIWQESGKTILFVTHSIPEAVFLSDRVIVMSPRPGTVERIFDIELARPRPLDLRESGEFASYTRSIRDIFQARGILRDL